MSRNRTLLALFLLFAGSALWFAPLLLSSLPGADEIAYFQGFELSRHGASPYEAPRYLYTPVFAWFGASLLSRFGFFATAVAIRLVNLAAACSLAWGASSLVGPREARLRFLMAALTLVAFRPLTTALVLGNLSPVAAFVTLAGVALSTASPVLAGTLLSLGLAIKPAGLPALVVLAAFRPRDGSRRHLFAVGVALGLAVGLFLTVDAHLLPAMLAHTEALDSNTNLSLGRVLAAMRIDLPAGVYGGLVVVACAAWTRARAVGQGGLVAIAGLASLLWLPRVWLHSFAFVLPAVALAIAAAGADRRAARNLASAEGRTAAAGARQRAALTAAFTLLGITCLELADAIGDLGTAIPFLPWNPAFHAAIPLVAAALLTRAAVREDARAP